jgi:resuscitation-promoting factor RpfB
MLAMLKKKIFLIPAGVLVGLALLAIVLHRPVTIVVDGKSQEIHTYALNAGWALHDAGIILSPTDLVTPATGENIGWLATIQVQRSSQVNLYTNAGLAKSFYSIQHTPAAFLKEAGLSLNPHDRLLWNSLPVDPAAALPEEAQYNLQILPAHAVSVVTGSASQTVTSDGPTLGDGLWAAGLRIGPADYLSAPYETEAGDTASIAVKLAAPIQVQVDGQVVKGKSAAATVGQALAELGVSLQGLDRSSPAENQPVPEDGMIKVIRVSEEIVLNQTSIPFKSEVVADSQSELDTTRLISSGRAGIQVTRQRVRREDGKEVSRQTEGQWTASQPQNQVTGYGTKIVIRTLDTPDGSFQYYRKVTVYATSFAPCNFIQFIGHCSYTTANGSTLQKGVIGTGEAWYHLFVNQHVYVDGYGPAIVADYGYLPGFQIDLGYNDADFVNWHRNTTLYFLTPAPANVPWSLPK